MTYNRCEITATINKISRRQNDYGRTVTRLRVTDTYGNEYRVTATAAFVDEIFSRGGADPVWFALGKQISFVAGVDGDRLVRPASMAFA